MASADMVRQAAKLLADRGYDGVSARQLATAAGQLDTTVPKAFAILLEMSRKQGQGQAQRTERLVREGAVQ